MAQVDPDIAALFAPLRPAQASDVVLREAREVLAHVDNPIDAELWGSDMIGALSGDGTDGTDVMSEPWYRRPRRAPPPRRSRCCGYSPRSGRPPSRRRRPRRRSG
jgi:hypothetical protein